MSGRPLSRRKGRRTRPVVKGNGFDTTKARPDPSYASAVLMKPEEGEPRDCAELNTKGPFDENPQVIGKIKRDCIPE